jgi:membrane carboxypeptidase/penicillin-binding protein PbpC
MMLRCGLFYVVLALGLGAGARDWVDTWITTTELPLLLADTSVEVHDRNGVLLRVYPVENGRTRMKISLDEVDAEFLDMLITYEDKRFYSHAGVDLRAAARSALQAVWHGKVVSGGSTITMQVARLLENSGTGRWSGKIRQIRLALALEHSLAKDEILALYLTHAPYGGPLEGVRAGSLAWFGKEPARLNMEEAALLVALPQSPESRRPDRHPMTALQARDRVLDRVKAPAQMRLAPVPAKLRPFPRLASHLTDLARQRVSKADRIDLTIDAGIQAQMEQLTRRAVQGRLAQLSAAIVVTDHQTGQVIASVGSPDYSDAAWHLWDILADMAPPPGVSAHRRKIAYKTGTSYGHRDAWSIGFDGQHVIGVWLGRPDGTPVPGAFGGDLAAPILFEAFGRVSTTHTPGPLPPPETLLVSTAELPLPLQRFRSRSAAFAPAANRPVVQFPPQGAVLHLSGFGVPLKLDAGVLPLTVLVNGAAVLTGLRERTIVLPLDEVGFSKISVIDAKGRSAEVEIRLQ